MHGATPPLPKYVLITHMDNFTLVSIPRVHDDEYRQTFGGAKICTGKGEHP
jgi:hypothetical protein